MENSSCIFGNGSCHGNSMAAGQAYDLIDPLYVPYCKISILFYGCCITLLCLCTIGWPHFSNRLFFYSGLFKYLPLYAKDLNELFSNEFFFFRSVIWVLLVTNSWFFNFYLTLCRFASCFWLMRKTILYKQVVFTAGFLASSRTLSNFHFWILSYFLLIIVSFCSLTCNCCNFLLYVPVFGWV